MSALAANSSVLYRESYQTQKEREQQHQQQQQQLLWSNVGISCFLLQTTNGRFRIDPRNRENHHLRKSERSCRDVRVKAFWSDLSRPTSVEMEAINDCDQLDQILLRARELSQPIIIDWMASWCRKCIYLKPKLEKLAAEFDTKMKFYYVDVNKVPQALVKRGNISKMPTIQIWKDGEKKEEVIGGHKAWLVIEEVRDMINKFV